MKEKIKNYLKLMRVEHYLKNILIFVPLFFSGEFMQKKESLIVVIGFVSFCFIASAVYCFNDLKDIEKDKIHPVKKNRPLAAGKVSKKEAIALMIAFIICSIILNIFIRKNI